MTYRILEDRAETGRVQGWEKFEFTGEVMEIRNEKGEGGEYRVVKGEFTPSGCVRDCGDYYIKANYASYTKIDKKTMKVEQDVDDE